LIKIIIPEENFKWHLEAFASELFIWSAVDVVSVTLQELLVLADGCD